MMTLVELIVQYPDFNLETDLHQALNAPTVSSVPAITAAAFTSLLVSTRLMGRLQRIASGILPSSPDAMDTAGTLVWWCANPSPSEFPVTDALFVTGLPQLAMYGVQVDLSLISEPRFTSPAQAAGLGEVTLEQIREARA